MRKAVGVDCSLDASISTMVSKFFWNQIKKENFHLTLKILVSQGAKNTCQKYNMVKIAMHSHNEMDRYSS